MTTIDKATKFFLRRMTLQENKDIKQLVHNDYKDNSDYKTTNL